jgi:hypothetical protein
VSLAAWELRFDRETFHKNTIAGVGWRGGDWFNWVANKTPLSPIRLSTAAVFV